MSMGGLDIAISVLDILGSVVQAVPVVGENLKAGTEIATEICELVKRMKDNREGYEQLADRAAKLLAAVANSLMKASLEKLKGMEANVSRLLLTLLEIRVTIERRTRTHIPIRTRKRDTCMSLICITTKSALRVSEDEEEIKNLGKMIDHMIQEFGVTSSIRVELVVEAVRASIEEMKREMLWTTMNGTLKTLEPVVSARWDSARWEEDTKIGSCMANTRVQLLADIVSWAGSPGVPFVFWLNGLAGTGKSTVAHTICAHLAETGLLGASFFVSRQAAERRRAPDILRTIAYQIARQQHAFAGAITATLRSSPDLASSSLLPKLASELLFKPASALSADAGLLIVIDALDECMEDDRGRPGGELLPVLLSGLRQLSGRMKLLLTSRVEPVIERMFMEASLGKQGKVMQLHSLDSKVVREDVRTYLTRTFADIATGWPNLALLPWPSLEDIDVLVDLAGVLFVFAATVVRFVRAPSQNPQTRLDVLLARRESVLVRPYDSLDRLYLQVLETSIRPERQGDTEELCDRMKKVVGSIVAAQQPLSVPVHAMLLDADLVEVQLMVESLSALLLSSIDAPVRIFHPSFPDFIVDPRRCNDPRLLVSLEQHHLRLARSSLMLLNQHLRYNIAYLNNADIANSDVKDLDGLLSRSICHNGHDMGPSLPQALFYAARYWTTHMASVSSSAVDSELLDALSCFCNDHLFHWIELLSLTRSLTYSTQSSLLAMIRWTEAFTDDTRVSRAAALLRDTERILQVYSEPLQSHALHIYRSAYVTMPHCPLLDAPAQARVPHLKHSLISPRAAHWGSLEPILEAGGVPHGVAVSHDGLMIVAGSSSGLLRVWTTANCEEVAQLSGHEGQVWSVAWSSDGLRFASSSQDRTIRVWDGRTFETLGLCMHDDEVNSVAFSPDNSLITSGSDDRTVRIWNAVSCEEVACLTGHNHIVRSVAFFPDGTRIASVSDDSAVRIWDTRTYEVLSGIQCSGNAYVVAVSPDSTRLAMIANSGVTDTLHLYDVVTLAQQAQVNVSAGYSTPWACAFSPDDNSIAIGTGAGAVQIWDARDLSHISTTRRHHGQVCSIAFSPDGSKLVSGSRDATVRIRPVSSSEEQFASIPGHYELVTQVVFSSDGSHLVSGSWDKTVRIWDGLTYEELAVLSGHNGAVLTVAYSPDGTRVASGSVDNTMCVWNTSTFQPIAILEGHKASVGFVTFAPDGALIASGSDDRTVRLWSSSTLQELARLEGHTAEVWFLAFSPASTRLASISKDNTLRVWDAIGFTQLAVLEARVPHRYLSSLVFSSDGKAVWTRHGDGPAWVSDDKHDLIWTAVPLATAIGTQIRNTEPVLNGDGWLDHKTESGTSRIWLPAERRGRQMAVASSGSQIVIGAIGGAMTMLDLSQ